jgi:hypothetical protein
MLKEALDDSNTALQIDPNCHLTMLVKADLLQRLERIQESFEALNKVDESKFNQNSPRFVRSLYIKSMGAHYI